MEVARGQLRVEAVQMKEKRSQYYPCLFLCYMVTRQVYSIQSSINLSQMRSVDYRDFTLRELFNVWCHIDLGVLGYMD